MDMAHIVPLFLLMSGEEDENRFLEIINLAMYEISRILRPGVDISDIRLGFLSAAVANYRLQQMYAARERAAVTYAGKLLKESQNTACEYAKALVKDYMKICEELLNVSDFVFSSFSGSEGEIKC